MMAIHPEVAEKIHAEIDQVIGRDRIPNLADRESLPYFDAALQEVLRVAPPVPLGEFELAWLRVVPSESIILQG